MATIEKYTDSAARDLIGHVERTLNFGNMANQEIDFSRTRENYDIGVFREHPYEHYKQLIERCYVYGRKDVKTLVGIVIPLPHDVPQGKERTFFESCYDFVQERYFPKVSIVSSRCHMDESRPHLHILAVPVTHNTDKKGLLRYKEPPASGQIDTRRECEKYKFKVSANDVLSRNAYLSFHSDLQSHLRKNGVPGTVQSGITRAQGGAMSVRELKRETAHERAEREARIERNLKAEYERSLEQTQGRFSSNRDIEVERSRF